MILKLDTTTAPHIRTQNSIKKIMLDVIIALLPAIVLSVIFSGYRSVLLIFVCMASAVLTEAIWQTLSKKNITVLDFSAAITGLLLALLLPATLQLWIAAIGSVFAILVVKQFFGGLGNNFVNPALAGYAFLLLSWGEIVATGRFSEPLHYAIFSIAILAGGLYLIERKIIDWRIPVIFITTVLTSTIVIFVVDFFFITQPEILSFAFLTQDLPLYIFTQYLIGNLVLAAFFMATDPVTTPLTKRGQVYFALGCGFLTVIIEFWGAMPSGAIFAILLMNILTPLIDKISRPKRYACGYTYQSPIKKTVTKRKVKSK